MKRNWVIAALAFQFCITALGAQNRVGSKIDTFTMIKKSRIYYHLEGKGAITVVFVSGLGEDHTTWQTVQDSISQFSFTLSYDRAGLGKSGYHQEPKDLLSLVRELHQVINRINFPQPFILVGHSLGCEIVKEYAALYPAHLKGIVFLDPGYNEQKLRAKLTDSVWRKREAALKLYVPKFNNAQQAELKNANKSCALANQIKKLPKVPVILFTATHINPNFPGSATEFKVKQTAHLLWLRSLPLATHRFVKESRHYIQNDAPEVVIDAVHKMVRSFNYVK